MEFFNLSLIAFLLFILHDLNTIKFKKNILGHSHWLGVLILALACIGAIKISLIDESISLTRTMIASSFGLAFILLMVETMVFQSPKQRGIYQMCRHPELIWFVGIYLSIIFAVGSTLIMTLAEFAVLLMIGYSIFREKVIYPILLEDYQEYKKVPFIIPNKISLINAFTKDVKVNRRRKIVNIKFGNK